MIRKATQDDIDAVFRLYEHHSLDISRVNDNEYAAEVQRDGFLIALETKEEMAERIEKNYLFHVYEDAGKIIGFINLNKEIYFPEDADNAIWLDKDLKKSYFHGSDSITLHEIIVDHENKRQGIATQLLESCNEILRNAHYNHLFSIVAFGPLTNCPSLIFHAKNGFERACATMPFDLFGLKNYMSLLFHKRLH